MTSTGLFEHLKKTEVPFIETSGIPRLGGTGGEVNDHGEEISPKPAKDSSPKR